MPFLFIGLALLALVAIGSYEVFTSNATRELRANNPLGVSLSSTFQWEGINTSNPGVAGPDGVLIPGVDNEKGDHLVIFKTIFDGLKAGAWLLHDGYFQAGFNTPASIGNRWSGDKTGGYGQSLTQIMNKIQSDKVYDTNTVLDFYSDGPTLMMALAIMENGHGDVENIPDQQYAGALQYGGEA